MRLMILLSIGFLLIGADFVLAEDGDINFSGEWILDADKSEIPEGRVGR
jgi:hypothetical protein